MARADIAERDQLRELAGCCYQMVGTLIHEGVKIPLVWMDELANAASGKPFDMEWLLPFAPSERIGSPEETQAAAAQDGWVDYWPVIRELERRVEELRSANLRFMDAYRSELITAAGILRALDAEQEKRRAAGAL